MPTIELNAKRGKKGKKVEPDLSLLVCEEGRSETTYWSKDLPGFGLRCRSSGVRVWFCQYRDKQTGETRKQTLGDIKKVPLKKARVDAERLFAKVKLDQDPAGEAAAKKAEAKAALRFGAAVEQYLERQQKRMKSRSHAEIVRHLRVDAKPLHTYRVDQVTQAMVADLLDSIADRAPVAANRVRTSLSALFSWAMKRGKATANPVSLTDKPSTEKSRDRVLSDAELSLVWRCTDGSGDFDRIVRLLILTGARCQEIAGMPWNEITPHNDGTATWLLPADRAKNERPLELLLPTMTTALLPPRREERELIFGVGSGPFSGWSNCKSRLDRHIAEANGEPIAPWRLHDLRRSFVSRINDLGLAEPHVIEALVNHVGGIGKAGVAGVYNHAVYREQKTAALARWCSHIERLTGGGDDAGGAEVVPFRRVG